MSLNEFYFSLLDILNHVKSNLYTEKIDTFYFENSSSDTKSDSIENTFTKNSLYKLKNIVFQCKKCEISKTRKNVVFGEGDIKSPLIIIGEAPGEKEDEIGSPFVGRSGNLLSKMLESIGLKRERIFISNVVKCRPPNNRGPYVSEIKNCSPYLEKQIELIKPKIILTLGNFSSQFILDKKGIGISKIRGSLIPYRKNKDIIVLPTYHPSAILRNPNLKYDTWKDLKKLRDFLKIQTPSIF